MVFGLDLLKVAAIGLIGVILAVSIGILCRLHGLGGELCLHA
jgi:hypothetical protein